MVVANKPKVAVAVARELAGSIWVALRPPSAVAATTGPRG
jgi:hypothetical protein